MNAWKKKKRRGKMKIRSDCHITTDDFWYDLIDGGYLDPYEICENEEDSDKIIDAVAVLEEFRMSCENQIEGLYR
jgi:hypothetical protein